MVSHCFTTSRQTWIETITFQVEISNLCKHHYRSNKKSLRHVLYTVGFFFCEGYTSLHLVTYEAQAINLKVLDDHICLSSS
jgi:hypothetical protein